MIDHPCILTKEIMKNLFISFPVSDWECYHRGSASTIIIEGTESGYPVLKDLQDNFIHNILSYSYFEDE